MDGKCSVSDVVRWMCEGPAQVYGMTGKGRLAEGMDADLVLVDMDSRREVRDVDTWTRVGWTALDGMELKQGLDTLFAMVWRGRFSPASRADTSIVTQYR